MRRLIYILPVLLAASPTWAAEGPASGYSGNIHSEILIIVFLVTALLLIGSLVLLHTVKVIANELIQATPLVAIEPVRLLEYEERAAIEKTKPGLWNRLLGLKPISEEKDLMMEHDFDGITELDNPTPAWFMGLFYVTIAFAVIYLLNYHVFKWSPLQDEEYAIEVKAAEANKNAFLAKSGNLIDENNVKLSTDAGVLSAGKAVFMQNCIACHLGQGQGSIGPNLTDEYWIHGGTVNNIFKIIKYGVPEKGMISWEKTLTPKQTSDVSNFILSLQGSNPPNPKEPQGIKVIN